MNINYENDELKPYEEPNMDFNDNQRIGTDEKDFSSFHAENRRMSL